ADNKPIAIAGRIVTTISVGERKTRVGFYVAHDLVIALLGLPYQRDSCMILDPYRREVTFGSRDDLFKQSGRKTVAINTIESAIDSGCTVRTSCACVLRGLTAHVVAARIAKGRDARGIVEPAAELLRRHGCLLASTYLRPDEVEEGDTLNMVVVNTSPRSVNFPRGSVIARLLPSQWDDRAQEVDVAYSFAGAIRLVSGNAIAGTVRVPALDVDDGRFLMPASVRMRSLAEPAVVATRNPVGDVPTNKPPSRCDVGTLTDDDPRFPREREHVIIPHDSLPPEARFPVGDADHPDTSQVRKQLRESVQWTNRLLHPAPRRVYTTADAESAYRDFAVEKSELPVESQQRFRKCVTNWTFRHTIAVDDDDMGRCGLYRVRYETLPGEPIKVPTRRIKPENIAAGYDTVDSWIKANNIQPSESPYSFPPVFVPKKDGRTRVCIDYRLLNNMTVKDSFPLPRIDDLLASLGKPKWFCTFDLQSGFMQMENDPATASKTAFTMPGRHYQFNVLPFGVSNGPGCFQRLMTIVLGGLLGEYCLCFIDDILVMADTLDEMFDKVNILFDRLERSGLKIRAKKAKVFRRKVVFLGFELSADGVRPDPEKIRAVIEWPEPTTYYHIRQVCGFFNFNSASIRDLAIRMAPLSSLLRGLPTGSGKKPRGNQKVRDEDLLGTKWGDEQAAAFLDLKTAITQAPALAYPDPYGRFVLLTDASRRGVGAQLQQEQDGRVLLIGFISRPCLPLRTAVHIGN
ncbi:MAG: hypothetical protein FD157_4173, partial [Rhodocyclaceae bacterium]